MPKAIATSTDPHAGSRSVTLRATQGIAITALVFAIFQIALGTSPLVVLALLGTTLATLAPVRAFGLSHIVGVLRGEMSIVGPRPHALASTAEDSLFWEIDDRYWHRHAAKPGLTGLAQVRGHRGATESTDALVNRVQSDLEYLANWSIWRDLRILFWTLRVMLHPNAF